VKKTGAAALPPSRPRFSALCFADVDGSLVAAVVTSNAFREVSRES